MKKNIKFLIILILSVFINNKASLENFTKQEPFKILTQYKKHLNSIKGRIEKFKIAEKLSELKLATNNNTFWQTFELAIANNCLEISHGLAREYVKNTKNTIKLFFNIPKSASPEIIDTIRKQYFFLYNDTEILKTNDNQTLKMTIDELAISKILSIMNCKLDLSNYFLDDIDNIANIFEPFDIQNFHKLEEINLSNNFITKIPKSLCNFRYLKNLNLCNNKIKECPACIANLKNIIKLDLSNNKIQNISSQINQLKNLIKINLDNNKLENIPINFDKLPNLRWISACNNQLEILPTKFLDKKGKIIKLNGNPFKKINEVAQNQTKSYSDNLYFCTAADEKFFPFLMHLIGSIHKTNFDNLEEIAVFDLGFTQEQRNILNTMQKIKVYDVELTHKDLCKIFIKTYFKAVTRGWYAWKPVIIKQALQMFPYVLYLDAGCTVLRPLDKLFEHIQEKGYFLIQDQSWHLKLIDPQTGSSEYKKTYFSIIDQCTDFVKEEFELNNPENSWIGELPELLSGVMGFTKKMLPDFINPIYELTKDLKYFEDDGSSKLGFGWARHDQIIFSIFARKLKLDLTLVNTISCLECNNKLYPFYFGDNNNDNKTDIFYACKGQLKFADFIRYKN